jgi:uncharacterized damage-inducible protein DinB
MKITRKTLIKSIFGSLIATPILAKAGDNELLIDIRTELKTSFKNSQKYTLTVFNQMPEDKLEWKYTPESMSFRTQFVHCITFTASQLAGRLNIKNPYEGRKNEFWAALSKGQLEAELQEFYDWLIKTFDSLTDETLLKKDQFVGGDMPHWKIIMAMENHIIHHRGQAICYLRLNGITPVGYIGWA